MPKKAYTYILYIKIILSVLFAGITNVAYCQSHPYRHFTVEDGLPSSEIYHVYQDSKGYIWFATDNGVSRYDGYSFQNFSTKDGLPDVTVFEIYEDYKHRIWFIPYSAQLSYFLNDSIYTFKYNALLKEKLDGRTNPLKLSFTVDSNNTVYYSDKINGAFSIDSTGNVNKLPDNYFFIKDDRVLRSRILTFGNDSLLFYTINVLKQNSPVYESLKLNTPISGPYTPTQYYAVKNKATVYISFRNKLFVVHNNKYFSEKETPQDVIWMNTDKYDNLWLGTRQGAMCFNQGNINIPPAYHLLIDYQVSSILIDTEGGYWFTSLYNGVFYLPNLQAHTLAINNKPLKQTINHVTGNANKIWVGSNNQVFEFKPPISQPKLILHDKSSHNLNLIYDQVKNRLLISGQSEIFEYNYSSKNCLNKLPKNLFTLVIHNGTNDLYVDSTGTIWSANYNGFHKFNEYDKTIKCLIYNYKFKAVCFIQKEKSFLLCGNEGLWIYSLNTKTADYVGDRHELFKCHFTCVVENKYHQNFWLGTKSNGIVIYNDSLVYNITTKDGLSSNFITALFYKDSIVWAATNKGVNKICLTKNDSSGFTIEILDMNNGLASNEVNDVYVYDSIAYVATNEGLSVLNYKALQLNKTPPPVYIKKVEVLDRDTLLKPYYGLLYKQNTINIEYVGLMYKNLDKKRYKYQFSRKGETPRWKETDENYLRLSFLPPGEYIFKVKAINENGIESIEPATLCFTIDPPYWKTWWFMSMAGLVVLSVLFLLYRIRMKEVEKRNRIEKGMMQEINRYRQQALSQQMNPHFIFNTLNSIQYYIYNNDNISSTKYLSKFSKLMRLILDNSRHDTVPLQKELDAMGLYLELESLRLEKSIDYKIKVDDRLDTYSHQIFPLLLQPYIENAIWHGLANKEGERRLGIELTEKTDFIECVIEDNGIGREKAMEIKSRKKHTFDSHGINITNKRIDIVNKIYNCKFDIQIIDLKNKEGIGIGTKVIVNIPKDLNQ